MQNNTATISSSRCSRSFAAPVPGYIFYFASNHICRKQYAVRSVYCTVCSRATHSEHKRCSRPAVSGVCQWEVLWSHQSILWRLRLGSVGMLTFPDSHLKTSLYHYPHNLVLFSTTYTTSTIYCEFFSLTCFGWPTNQKQFYVFAGFNIDDITRFFTLAGNVLQHIWQSLRFCSKPQSFPWHSAFFQASSSPLSFFHPHVSAVISRSPSVTVLPWAFPAPVVHRAAHWQNKGPLSAPELPC